MNSDEHKALREKLGLTQDALAKRIGVTRRTIIYRENGGKITKQAEIAIRSLAATKFRNTRKTL